MIKKVLIVNIHSIHKTNGTGITIRNLLNDYPKENIMELYFEELKNEKIKEFANVSSIRLNPKIRFAHYLFRIKLGNKVSSKISAEVDKENIRLDYAPGFSISEKVQEFLRGFFDISPIFLNRETFIAIEHFKPDIIYTLGSCIFPLKISLIISKKWKTPVLLHYMDNWRETLYSKSQFSFFFKKTMHSTIKKIENTSMYAVTISDEMSKEYRKYNEKIIYKVLMNVPIMHYKKNTSTQKRKDSFIELVYTGGLHLNRFKSLKVIEEVILSNKMDEKLRLIIYTSELDRIKYENIFDKRVTSFSNYVNHNEIYKVFNDSDYLVHIETFDDKYLDHIKYSISTKIVEYQFSGKPIICYARSCFAVSNYIKSNKLGYVASDINELSNILKNIVQVAKKEANFCNEDRLSKIYESNTLSDIFDEVLEKQG